jgi:ion channel
MVSLVVVWRRLVRTIRHALAEEDFGPILAAGLTLIALGTITYTLANDWSVIDSFYFSVATLTTSTPADPDLVLADGWMRLFTACYTLLGIGVLVEVARRLGVSFIAVRGREKHEA